MNRAASLILIGIVAIGLRAAPNTWTSIGPFGGSAHALAVDPVSPHTVYAGTSAGLLKTTDGGANWHPANSGLPGTPSVLLIDPVDPNTVYAGGSASGQPGIFKSTNAGQSWEPSFAGLESSVQDVNSLAIDPQNHNTIYIGTQACFQPSGSPGFVEGGENLCWRPGVFKSLNGGASWTVASAGLPLDTGFFEVVRALATDPRNPNTLFAALSDGVFKSTNGGASWNLAGPFGAFALFIDPRNPDTTYVATTNGVVKTTDAGAHWIPAGGTYPSDCCGALVIDSADPNTMYVGGRYGVYKSSDGGAHWITALAVPRDVVDHPYASGESYVGLALDQQNPGILYAAARGLGLFRSTDRGTNWSPVNSGLAKTVIYAVAPDTHNPGTIYAGTLAGFFKTTDGGANWVGPDSGLPAGRIMESIAIDPNNSSTIYAAMSGGLGLATFGTRAAGIFKSTDAGATWTSIGPQMDSTYFFPSLAIDPHDRETIYAGGISGCAYQCFLLAPGARAGILKSQDGGASWVAVGSFPANVQSVVIDPQRLGNVYAVAGQVIFKSSDGGASWRDLGAPRVPPMPTPPCDDCDVPFLADVGALAIDPQLPDVLYAGGYAGVSKSTDGGASWKVMNVGLALTGAQTIGALVVDPYDSNTVYATRIVATNLGQIYLDPGQLFRSTDGAMTWSGIAGGPAVSIITAAPQMPATIYAGTAAGGIFVITFPPSGSPDGAGSNEEAMTNNDQQ